MFNALRATGLKTRVSNRAFSSTSPAFHDVSKLTIIGRLARDPELKTSKNNKDFVSYVVATANYPPPPPNPDGSRAESTTTWHRVFSFNEGSNRYLSTLKKGSRVYVEANYELREPEAGADASTPQGQRQIFLRHEALRVLSYPPRRDDEAAAEDGSL